MDRERSAQSKCPCYRGDFQGVGKLGIDPEVLPHTLSYRPCIHLVEESAMTSPSCKADCGTGLKMQRPRRTSILHHLTQSLLATQTYQSNYHQSCQDEPRPRPENDLLNLRYTLT
jgi:hypothetical protein